VWRVGGWIALRYVSRGWSVCDGAERRKNICGAEMGGSAKQ